MAGRSLTFLALPGVPEILAGADLAAVASDALQRAGESLRPGDILVFAQKVVSKAEGRMVRLRDVQPSARALEIAARCLKDPRLVELVLAESTDVVRVAPNVVVTRHRRGYVLANAGIDHSNTGASPDDDVVLLLPVDPDASARALRHALEACCGVAPGVIVSDSFGRPWRLGTVNVALGVAGVAALVDMRGDRDRDGRTLQITQVAVADALAAGAGLAMGEAAEGSPIVLVRGFSSRGLPGDGQALIRPAHEDLFR
jgi:coenzyme F420-0:L-glutamate ligase/coenzyme F420-1:gamma-L-glutamate ligase